MEATRVNKYKLTYEVIYHYTFDVEACDEDQAFDNHVFDETKTIDQTFIEYNIIDTQEIQP